MFRLFCVFLADILCTRGEERAELLLWAPASCTSEKKNRTQALSQTSEPLLMIPSFLCSTFQLHVNMFHINRCKHNRKLKVKQKLENTSLERQSKSLYNWESGKGRRVVLHYTLPVFLIPGAALLLPAQPVSIMWLKTCFPAARNKKHILPWHTAGVWTRELWHLAVAVHGVTSPVVSPAGDMSPIAMPAFLLGPSSSQLPIQLCLTFSAQLSWDSGLCTALTEVQVVLWVLQNERQQTASFWTARFAAARMQNRWRPVTSERICQYSYSSYRKTPS